MEQDFTKGLNVCIGNYGYYNEGSRNASELLNDGKQAIETSLQEH